MSIITLDEPGKEVLLLGNEAIPWGALEAGVKFCTAYPGTPSTEIIGSLAQVAKHQKIYVEWSVNEKVALEVAAAASFSGLRAICAMKHNGINVASDFLLHLNMVGVKGGLLSLLAMIPQLTPAPTSKTREFMRSSPSFPCLSQPLFRKRKI